METIYIETTFVGHLTGNLMSDPLVSARQQLTREWWQHHSPLYQLFVSQLVLEECGVGNAKLAKERLDAVETLDLLDGTDETDALAATLIA